MEGLVDVEATAPTPDFREVEGEAVIRFEAGGTVPETGGGDDEHRDWLDLGVTVTVDGATYEGPRGWSHFE